MADAFGLSGKVAVVTGSARGIGKAIAARYADMGAKVVVSDIQEEMGRAVAEELGTEAFFHPCDIASEGQAHALMDAAVERYGRVDILVNNADAGDARTRVTVEEFPSEAWRHKVDIAVHGTFYCSQAGARHMCRQGAGCIINLASVAGVVPLRLQIAHDATKAAIIRMSQAMALELGPRGIRVNAIAPGVTLAEGTRPVFESVDESTRTFAERVASFIPLGRVGLAEDVADAALFLASDLAGYVTGHNLIVDGGWPAGHYRDH